MEKEILRADIMDDDRKQKILINTSYLQVKTKKHAITVYSTINEVAEEQNHERRDACADERVEDCRGDIRDVGPNKTRAGFHFFISDNHDSHDDSLDVHYTI